MNLSNVFMSSLAAIGITLLVVYSGWQVALGVFLLAWSHNVEKH